MRILLDTHVLLWALTEPDKLSQESRALITAAENKVLFSAASVWELAIKAQIGRSNIPISLSELAHAATRSGFEELPIYSASAALVAGLPLHHRDPFDRLLIAQAISEPAKLFTRDPKLLPYSELVKIV